MGLEGPEHTWPQHKADDCQRRQDELRLHILVHVMQPRDCSGAGSRGVQGSRAGCRRFSGQRQTAGVLKMGMDSCEWSGWVGQGGVGWARWWKARHSARPPALLQRTIRRAVAHHQVSLPAIKVRDHLPRSGLAGDIALQQAGGQVFQRRGALAAARRRERAGSGRAVLPGRGEDGPR